MIQEIQQFALDTITFNTYWGLATYWAPIGACAVGYTMRTFTNFRKDRIKRAQYLAREAGYYNPTDTLGTLIGRAIITICPIANLWAAAFDIAPEALGDVIRYVERAFNTPLVPEKKRLKNDTRPS